MLKSILLYLVVFSMSFQTPLAAIWNIPSLYHHFKAHQSNEANLNFRDFLYEHYFDPNQHTEKHPEQHSSLPFFSINHFIVAPIYIENNIIFYSIGKKIISESNQNFILKDLIPQFSLSKIFQPPQF